MLPALSAIIYASLTGVVFLFQLAIAAGAPWGHLTMGGKYVGILPHKMRFMMVFQGLLLVLLATAVLSRAGVAFEKLEEMGNVTVWVAVGVSFLSLVLNLITPSRGERMLWAPVAALMLATSLHVALS